MLWKPPLSKLMRCIMVGRCFGSSVLVFDAHDRREIGKPFGIELMVIDGGGGCVMRGGLFVWYDRYMTCSSSFGDLFTWYDK